MNNILLCLTVLLMLALASPAALTDDFDVDWYTIDGGGDMWTTGGDFELSGTIGQPDAGEMSGGTYTLTGGFWFEQVCGDCNYDGGVNLFDFQGFETCLSGPDGGLEPGCSCLDFDGDEDVDLQDFAGFQAVFTGP